MRNIIIGSMISIISLCCNAQPMTDKDETILGNGAILKSYESKYPVKLPEELKKKILKTYQQTTNIVSYADNASGPVSVEGDYHDIIATGLVNCYFPNNTDKIISIIIEIYMCIENDNCHYEKRNYDLSSGAFIACKYNISTTEEITKIGTFEDELTSTLKSNVGDNLYSLSTATVTIY